MGATAVGLLAITLLIGSSEGGAKAWLRFGSVAPDLGGRQDLLHFRRCGDARPSVQQSATCGCSSVLPACGGCLALQNDFGTALVFFVTFLVIAYLRSGDFATLGLVCAGCFGGGMVMLTIKPHVARASRRGVTSGRTFCPTRASSRPIR